MKLINFMLIISLVWGVAQSYRVKKCQCSEHGLCNLTTSQPTCDCQKNFIGAFCNLSSISVNQQSYTAVEVQTHSTYLIYNPKNINYYQFQLSVCIQKPVRNFVNLISIATEQFNGSISEPFILKTQPFDSLKGCFKIKTDYSAFMEKSNGQITRLIIQIYLSSNKMKQLNNKYSERNQYHPNESIKVKITPYPFFQHSIIINTLYISLLIGAFLLLFALIKFWKDKYFPGYLSESQAIRKFNSIMPVKKYFDVEDESSSPKSFNDNKQNQCVICLQVFSTQDQIRQTPCRHIFHHACLDEWGAKNITCPICTSILYLPNRMVRQHCKNILQTDRSY